jgi:hypothetical protein
MRPAVPRKPSSEPAQFLQGAPVLEVVSVELTVEFFVHSLGFLCDFQSSEYGVVWRDNVALHFIRSNDIPRPIRMFHWLVDVNAYYDELQRCGTEITVEIGDREYGIRDFSVTDINGFILVFGQDIY